MSSFDSQPGKPPGLDRLNELHLLHHIFVGALYDQIHDTNRHFYSLKPFYIIFALMTRRGFGVISLWVYTPLKHTSINYSNLQSLTLLAT